jgi:hypothetical protein
MDTYPERVSRFERAKLLHDYFKHLTTISTGSLVFLVTFHDKFKDGTWGLRWFAATLIAFLVCIVGSVLAQTAYIWYASSEPRAFGKFGYVGGLFASWIGFLGGVAFLVIFAITRL